MYVDTWWRSWGKMPPNIGSTSTLLGTVLASESQWELCITPSHGASFAPARSIATVTASSPALLVSVVERSKCITLTLSQMAAPNYRRRMGSSRFARGIIGCFMASSTDRSNGRDVLTSTGRARRDGSVRSGSTKPRKDQAASGWLPPLLANGAPMVAPGVA